ncbi:MAG: hypothetical protein Q4A05_11010 [Ruminococcus sp.]|nr:hypothetical protein [Ruminococcus sp.]
MKRFIIWAVLMVVVTFCVNAVGTVVVKALLADTLAASMTGYAAKGEKMLRPTPTEPDGNSKSNGLAGLAVRELLDNTRILDGTSFLAGFLFMNDTIDQSVIIFDKDGMSPLSKGSFANAYADNGESLPQMKNSVGLISVDEFCKNDCAKDVFELLKKTPDAVVKVNSYSDFVVSPASLTVYDAGGSSVGTFECSASGNIVSADNVYVYNGNTGADESDDRLCSFLKEMETVYLGERHSDRVAEKLADKVSFGSDTSYKKSQFGLGHYTVKMYEVSGDYAMVTVIDIGFVKSVLLYVAIAAVPITLLTFLLGRRKKNDY